MHFQPTDPFNTYQSQCELENFKEQRKEELDFQASVKSLADSAKKTADLALKKSKQADIKGWISIAISLLAFIWSVVSSFLK